jgi:RNA polymerase sigma-70 factor (ECF subfamily)
MPESDISGQIFLFAKREAPTGAAAQPAVETLSPEALLVERVCAGDEQAFAEFYKLFAPMVHGVILARVAHDEVQDIVQEVFLSAYKNLHTLRDKNAAGPWLGTIARNQVYEFYRRAKPTEELTDEFTRKDSPKTEANEVLAAIRTLSDTYRETLVMRLVEGMTGPEIAERTGLTHESVRVNLHRGMKLLREKLGITE